MEQNRTRILLFRHGEVANAAERVYNGHFDIALSSKGTRQFESIAERLSKEHIDAVYSSDLVRASTGAKLIAARHNISHVQSMELRELNYGIWEGMKVKDVLERYKEEMRKRYNDIITHRIKGGETLFEMNHRVVTYAENIFNFNMGKTIVVVAHGGVNRILLLWALNSDLINFNHIIQGYAAFNIINYFSNKWRDVELMNLLPGENDE